MTLLMLAAAGCEDVELPPPDHLACAIDAPHELLPREVKQIRLGMSLAAMSRLLGRPDYSPVAGQHYFLTGGLCPMSPGAVIMADCAVIAEFRRFEYGIAPDDVVTNSLQSCHWGPINE
jgi:hypothetical protein